MAGNHLAARVFGEKVAEVRLVLVEERAETGDLDRLGVAHVVGNDQSRDIHAVENVTDVVQDIGGDLGYADTARAYIPPF